ncbi:MAG TPA: hypothetical protein DEB06_09890 [Phycisphaerales bacterium]|nr:hypothetical protein [Phycisphaerales bacterium]
MIEPERLVAWTLGELEPREAEAIRDALARDPVLAAQAARVRGTLEALGRAPALDAAFAVADGPKTALKSLAPRPASMLWRELVGLASRAVASLSFDSAASGPALAGFRGQHDSRRLIYETEGGAALDLKIDPAPGRADEVTVLGQVLGPDPAQTIHYSPSGADEGGSAPVDDSGFFEFTTRAGDTALLVRFKDSAMLVPRVTLSH